MAACRPSPNTRLWNVLRVCVCACGVMQSFFVSPSAFGQGRLEALRQDVRVADPDATSVPPNPPPPSRPEEPSCNGYHPEHNDGCNQGNDGLTAGVFWLTLGAVTSPFWAPHTALDDDFSVARSFARYPYADASGYMLLGQPEGSRQWSAQFSADYATTFDDLSRVGGHLLVDSAWRWGVDTEMGYFQENLPHNGHDNLWLGDCNLVFRFAQNENMLWRTGVGLNWLDDSRHTDFGFNFTYGFDWFPRKPWVVSAAIDWGNLGYSGLFHFRGTVGVLVNRIEAYTGYEYYDFDHVQTNALIGGVRLWF